MNVLMLIHRLPFPADRGAKLRAALELRWLAERHDVWCAGFWETEDGRSAAGRAALQEARTRCRDLLAIPLSNCTAAARAAGSLLTGSTATQGYFSSADLERQVLAWSRQVKFDVVLAFSSSMAPLALRVPAGRHVLDMVDLDSTKWAECADSGAGLLRYIHRIEARRLARGEREWIAAFDATVLVNAREADQLEPALRSRVHVIETGHLTDIAPTAAAAPLPDEPVVGMLGAMDYGPNIDAACLLAREIWPLVRAGQPDARCLIVGRSPTRAVRQLHNTELGMSVTGTVPAIEPYLDQMRVHVAPLRVARGVQTKVVAAMAAGRPCVVTSRVAQGIEAVPGRDYLVADSSHDFAEAVLALLRNRATARAIGQSGREFVTRRFNPAAGLEQLERLLAGQKPLATEAA